MNIKIYSTPSCVYCKMLKDYLSQKKIAFEDINVATNHVVGREMVKKSGQMGVPVSIITTENGKEEIIIGFDKAHISKLLGIKE